LTVMGYGDSNKADDFDKNTSWDVTHPGTLQEVDVSYIDSDQCKEDFWPYLTKNMMCASNTGGKDACKGDSGGPLFDKTNDMVVGVVSYNDGQCARDRPMVYARVASQWDWIQSTICNDHSFPQPRFCTCTDSPNWLDSENDGSNGKEQLPTGNTLTGQMSPNQYIMSNNKRYILTYQTDGNLVLYKNGNDVHRLSCLWGSGTQQTSPRKVSMQGDGNLVVYGEHKARWASHTNSEENRGSRLVMQDDGNLVMYRPDGTPIWSTGTHGA